MPDAHIDIIAAAAGKAWAKQASNAARRLFTKLEKEAAEPQAQAMAPIPLASPQEFPDVPFLQNRLPPLYQHPSGTTQLGTINFERNKELWPAMPVSPGRDSGAGVLRVSQHGGGEGQFNYGSPYADGNNYQYTLGNPMATDSDGKVTRSTNLPLGDRAALLNPAAFAPVPPTPQTFPDDREARYAVHRLNTSRSTAARDAVETGPALPANANPSTLISAACNSDPAGCTPATYAKWLNAERGINAGYPSQLLSQLPALPDHRSNPDQPSSEEENYADTRRVEEALGHAHEGEPPKLSPANLSLYLSGERGLSPPMPPPPPPPNGMPTAPQLSPLNLNKVVMTPPGNYAIGILPGPASNILPDSESGSFGSPYETDAIKGQSSAHEYRLTRGGDPMNENHWTDTGVYTDARQAAVPSSRGLYNEAQEFGRHLGLSKELGGGDLNSYLDKIRDINNNPDATYLQKVHSNFARRAGSTLQFGREVGGIGHDVVAPLLRAAQPVEAVNKRVMGPGYLPPYRSSEKAGSVTADDDIDVIASAAGKAWVKQADLLPGIQLQPHQQRIADKVTADENRMLVYHGLGSGKSLAAIAAAEAAKRKFGDSYGVVVPAALKGNFNKEIKKFTDSDPEVMSYTALGMGKQFQDPPETLIMDEAHRLRNPDGDAASAASQQARNARNLLLLTGSPITNSPTDLASLLSLLHNKQITPEQFDARYIGHKTVNPGVINWFRGIKPGEQPVVQNEKELRGLLKGHVDYQPSKNPNGVNVSEETIKVPLSPAQQKIQKAVRTKIPPGFLWKLDQEFPLSRDELSKLNSFMTGLRQVSMSTRPFRADKDPYKSFEQSSKLQLAMKNLQSTLGSDPRKKAIIYSNHIGSGLSPYAAALEKNKIPHALFHGSISPTERQKAVDDYNAGKLRALLIGPAGAEGLSTKGTSLIQLLDPHWHESRTQQARGRGLRFDSHEGLPEELKNVAVQRYLSSSEDPSWLGKLMGYTRERTGDEVLARLAANKEMLNDKFRKILQEEGTQKTSAEVSLIGARAWYKAAAAELAQQPKAKSNKKKPAHTPWLIPGLAGAGALSSGLAYGMANDQQISNVREAIKNYDPNSFNTGAFPENHTGLTYYEKTLAPAAQLKPFGTPVGELLVKLRSSPAIMKALHTEPYLLKSPADQLGVGGLAHYNSFANGPVSAYAHQLNSRLSSEIVPEELAPAGTRYGDWMERKLKDFTTKQISNAGAPLEITPKFMPNAQQEQLMKDFNKSLTPAEQQYRAKTENPGPTYATQMGNYLPKAKMFSDLRDNLKNVGFTGIGAGAGGAAGHYLMRNRKNKSPLGYWASVLGGTGLGGAASYLGGTEPGQRQLAQIVKSLRGAYAKR
jgi:Helicase conserved C-terminal domain/SNF2-related domain